MFKNASKTSGWGARAPDTSDGDESSSLLNFELTIQEKLLSVMSDREIIFIAAPLGLFTVALIVATYCITKRKVGHKIDEKCSDEDPLVLGKMSKSQSMK